MISFPLLFAQYSNFFDFFPPSIQTLFSQEDRPKTSEFAHLYTQTSS
jgi:hypothetical protein